MLDKMKTRLQYKAFIDQPKKLLGSLTDAHFGDRPEVTRDLIEKRLEAQMTAVESRSLDQLMRDKNAERSGFKMQSTSRTLHAAEFGKPGFSYQSDQTTFASEANKRLKRQQEIAQLLKQKE